MPHDEALQFHDDTAGHVELQDKTLAHGRHGCRNHEEARRRQITRPACSKLSRAVAELHEESLLFPDRESLFHVTSAGPATYFLQIWNETLIVFAIL